MKRWGLIFLLLLTMLGGAFAQSSSAFVDTTWDDGMSNPDLFPDFGSRWNLYTILDETCGGSCTATCPANETVTNQFLGHTAVQANVGSIGSIGVPDLGSLASNNDGTVLAVVNSLPYLFNGTSQSWKLLNGSTVTQVTSGGHNAIYALAYGNIYHFVFDSPAHRDTNGNTIPSGNWQLVISGSGASQIVVGDFSNTIYALRSGGIYKWTGSAWSQLGTKTNVTQFSVGGSAGAPVAAVTTGGFAVYYAGTWYSGISVPFTPKKVTYNGARNAYVVDTANAVWQGHATTNYGTWTFTKLNHTAQMVAVASGEDALWEVNTANQMQRYYLSPSTTASHSLNVGTASTLQGGTIGLNFPSTNLFNPGFTDNASAKVLSCSGVIMFQWQITDVVEFAQTRLKFTSYGACTTDPILGEEVCDVNVVPWCTPATTPPDYSPYAIARDIYPAAAFYDADAICTRLGPGHAWFCGGVNFMKTPSPLPLDVCTYNP